MKFKIKANIGDFAPSSRTMTDKGLLCRDATLAISPQVREYHPFELNMPANKGKMVKLYTPPDILFSADVIDNFNGSDFVNEHPSGNKVTTKNWRKHSIGMGINVRRDGNKMLGDLLVRDADAIDAIQSNKKVELSLGYTVTVDAVAGVSEDGTEYDAIVTNMVGDHIALVKRGRGGKEVRIGDKQTESKMRKIKLANGMTFEIDGENLEAFEQGLQSQNADYDALKAKADSEIEIGGQKFKVSDTVAIQAAFDAIAKQKTDAESNAKEQSDKVAELEKTAIKPEDVEQLAAERSETVEQAKSLKPDLDDKGKSIEAIKTEVVEANAENPSVKAIINNPNVGDAEPAIIETAFRVLVATRDKSTTTKTTQVGDNATSKALSNLTNGKEMSAEDIIRQAKSNSYK